MNIFAAVRNAPRPETLHPRQPQMAIRTVINAFVDVTGERREDLAGPRQTTAVVRARHELMYILRLLTPETFSAIGRMLGGRDMASVHAAVTKIASQAQRDPTYLARLDDLIERIRKVDPAMDTGRRIASRRIAAALNVLRNTDLTDGQARRAALAILDTGEVPHGQ
jgi:Bacterial dnaA protein helix-turn-helix